MEGFRKSTTEMRSWFHKNECYPKGILEKEMDKIEFSAYTRRNKREGHVG